MYSVMTKLSDMVRSLDHLNKQKFGESIQDIRSELSERDFLLPDNDPWLSQLLLLLDKLSPESVGRKSDVSLAMSHPKTTAE